MAPQIHPQSYENLDSALRSINREAQGDPEPLGSEVETSPTDEDEERNTDNGDDEDSEDEQFGWGAAHGRHSAHPGK
jgi:hypothetical protein